MTVTWALVTAMLVFGGCASFRGVPPGESAPVAPEVDPTPDAEVTLRAALMALDRGNVLVARRRLQRITAECGAPDRAVRHRAVLLLASIALDPGNPDGTPDEAALITARVIHEAEPGDSDAVLARALYLLALDRGAAPVTSFDPDGEPAGCAPPFGEPRTAPLSLPEAVTPTSAARLAALQDSLTARTDSLRTLREQLSSSRQRTEVLEAEIERIRILLRGGLDGPDTIRQHR